MNKEKIAEILGWALASLFAVLLLGMGVMGAGLMLSKAANAADIPKPIVSHMFSNVYQIKAPEHYGTGYWITDRLILTNCHVATMNRELFLMAVSDAHNQAYRIDMVLCDEDTDLAILESRSPNPDVQPITIADTSIPFGSEIFSAGHGLGLPLSPKRGIAGTDYTNDRRSMILPGAGPGDSGSPIWNVKGELVGMLNSGMQIQGIGLSERSFFINLATIKTYLKGIEAKVSRSKDHEGE